MAMPVSASFGHFLEMSYAGLPASMGKLPTAHSAMLQSNPQTDRALAMTTLVQPRHDLSPIEIDVIEDNLYDFNRQATGHHDGRRLGFVIRDEVGRTIAVAAGYSWAGTSELKQMWVDEAYRGRGYARELLNAFIAEAVSRGVRRIWVASYDFQAPAMYEKAGFARMAEFEGWPEGYTNIILCKTLAEPWRNAVAPNAS
jgi:ribosomal protein S18 acetylase RimI-like enzyme